MDISRFQTLKEVHEYYSTHNRCKLKTVSTQPVYELKKPKSGIVLIGEAPGREEDKQGKPFVGAAGKLLDEMLGKIDMTRSDVYVSNVVKYRPPNNREPLDEEKDACRVWLNAELLFLKPKVIVTLGSHALDRFVKGAKISVSHGHTFSHSSGIPIFAMYHPAVGLYNPSLKNTLQNDFLKLKDFINSGYKLEESTENDQEFDKEKQNAVNDILNL